MSSTPLRNPTAGERPAACAGPPPAKRARRRHTPGGAQLGQQASREAQRLAAAILEVLGGARTPAQAAQAVGVSLPRYFQLESRVMHALVAACEARPRGPGPSAERERAALAQQVQRLERELHRQQALVRLAQRSVGLLPAKVEPDKKVPGKRKRRRPVARALRAAEQLLQQSQAPESTPALGTPAPGP